VPNIKFKPGLNYPANPLQSAWFTVLKTSPLPQWRGVEWSGGSGEESRDGDVTESALGALLTRPLYLYTCACPLPSRYQRRCCSTIRHSRAFLPTCAPERGYSCTWGLPRVPADSRHGVWLFRLICMRGSGTRIGNEDRERGSGTRIGSEDRERGCRGSFETVYFLVLLPLAGAQ
jgi:hypothetical protein